MDFLPDNHREKCRCCFERQKQVKITENIRNYFFLLTQIELISSTTYSDEICNDCFRVLRNFSRFKKDASAKQRLLYQTIPEGLSEELSEKVSAKVKKEFPENLGYDGLLPVKQEVESDDETNEYFSNSDILQQSLLEDFEPIETFKYEFERKSEPTDESTFSMTLGPAKRKNKQRKTSSKAEGSSRRTKCQECGKMVVYLRGHMETAHLKDGRFICDLCGVQCQTRSNMSRHMERKHFSKRCKVPSCDFATSDKEAFKMHRRAHKKVTCHVCGKEFFRRYLLVNHIRIVHDQDYRIKCKFCDKLFPYQNSLDLHMSKEHNGTKDHLCTVCGKLFGNNQRMLDHKLTVHGEKKFVCPVEGCGRKFSKRHRLKTHELMHTKERKFICDQCPMSYGHRDQLVTHVKVEHFGLRCHCEIPGCEQIIRRRQSYQKHLRGHHKLPADLVKEIMNRTEYQ